MIPVSIIDYLEKNKVPFQRRPHAKAMGAQELAASLHITAYSVAKSVIVDADGQKWIAVLPASETVNLPRLAEVLGARALRLLEEPGSAPSGFSPAGSRPNASEKPGHAEVKVGISCSKRSQLSAVQTSVRACPNERISIATFAACSSLGASKTSR